MNREQALRAGGSIALATVGVILAIPTSAFIAARLSSENAPFVASAILVVGVAAVLGLAGRLFVGPEWRE